MSSVAMATFFLTFILGSHARKHGSHGRVLYWNCSAPPSAALMLQANSLELHDLFDDLRRRVAIIVARA